MKEFIININDSGQRIEKFLTKAVKNLPKSMLYKSIRTKKIKLNGKRCEISTILKEKDILTLYLNDDFFTDEFDYRFLKANTDINIVYEDENIIIINKEKGIVVYDDNDVNVNTLINKMKKYLYEKGEYNIEKENSFSPAICNRLDRNTCGLIIGAKNAQALRLINEKIRKREISKKYLCLTIKNPPNIEDTLTAYIYKDSETNKVNISEKMQEKYSEIITKFKLLKTVDDLSLVEVELITGKTHQIRAHLSFEGFPILGDTKYGNYNTNDRYKVYHQALCAYKIEFKFQDENFLSYLNKREFSISDIWFLNIDKIKERRFGI